ncbi:MAG: prepilin-type N-terminal cleavage/methylation domain-containing protein [Pyrinomonadaceae bacterium]|nr:prepilin-type N-terminal cleavage/methylation domain-containing protein [Pyrinomonadaceae bacterium]
MKGTTQNQKGFSLVELLVVVIIVAIVAAIAIPSLLASRRAANEASAISSLRTIHSAQATYFGTTGGNTTYTSLAALGTSGLVDTVLAAGAKSGYNFTAAVGTPTSVYCGTAVPTSTGITGTGDRSFAVSQPGVIYGIAGGAAPTCSNTTGAITSGSPIQ